MTTECAFNIKGPICAPKVIKKLNKIGPNMNKIKEKLNCDTESCIYTRSEVIDIIGENEVNNILKQFFKPKGPKFTTEWLSNYNIDDVLEQFEKKYPSFLHVYFQMRDFAKNTLSEKEKRDPEMLKRSLADIDFAKKIKEGIKTFGCVLNTDYSSGSGEHWFCLFGDFRKEPYQLEYFNSSGQSPLDEIQLWIDKTKHSIELKLGKKVKKIIHRTQHQYDSHSCGPYSLYYIISRLKGIDCEVFNNCVGGDKKMIEFRKELFR